MYPGAVRLGENLRQGVCRLFATWDDAVLAIKQRSKPLLPCRHYMHYERFPYFTNGYIVSLAPGITQGLFKGYVFVNYLACFYENRDFVRSVYECMV